MLSVGNGKGFSQVLTNLLQMAGCQGSSFGLTSPAIIRVQAGKTQKEERRKGRSTFLNTWWQESPGLKGQPDPLSSGVNNMGVYRPTLCSASRVIDISHQTALGRAAQASIINPHYKLPQCAEGTEGNTNDLAVATTRSEIAKGGSK